MPKKRKTITLLVPKAGGQVPRHPPEDLQEQLENDRLHAATNVDLLPRGEDHHQHPQTITRKTSLQPREKITTLNHLPRDPVVAVANAVLLLLLPEVVVVVDPHHAEEVLPTDEEMWSRTDVGLPAEVRVSGKQRLRP